MENQNAKGICVEEDPAISLEQRIGVYQKVNSLLEQVSYCYVIHLH